MMGVQKYRNFARISGYVRVAAILGMCMAFSAGTCGCSAILNASIPRKIYESSMVVPLPIPDAGSLAVEKRSQEYNLSLAVDRVAGPYYKRYNLGTATNLMGPGMGSVAAYRDQVAGPLPDEITRYLKRTRTFREITQTSETKADLILTLHLTRFELRIDSDSEMTFRGMGNTEIKNTSVSEGQITGNFVLKTDNGTEVFDLPIALRFGPKTQITKGKGYTLGKGPSPEETQQLLTSQEAIVEEMFKLLVRKLQEHDTYLAKLAGPSIPQTTPQRQIPGGPVGRRFAVIVGLSRYKHVSSALPNLKYADRDAKQLASFLLSPAGGRFDPQNMRLLVNEQATYRNIRAALFEFLQAAIDKDMVIIYFSGHGVPNPKKLDQLYLMCYDSDPNHIASTAFPMHDLRTALQYNIEARRVLVLADACHSAGIAVEGRRAVGVSQNKVNRYLSQLSKTKPGTAIFTSSEGSELSQEASRWGKGHGVFTWALLQAMSGKADGYGGEKDGIVTLGEVIEYTRDFVRRETHNAQHPAVAGVFDRSLPMGIVNPPTAKSNP